MTITFPQVSTAQQIEQVATLASDIWHEYYITLISRDQIAYMIDKYQSIPAIERQIRSEGYAYYLMQHGAEAVGYMAVKQEDGKLFLSKFYVSRAHRGKGYASAADAFLEQLCTDSGLSSIWLTVNRDNRSSIAVYEKKGFRTIREQVADIGNGFVMDDFVMEKELAPKSV